MIRVPRLTSETIALANLDAEIARLRRRVQTELQPVDCADLVDHLLVRAAVTACSSDAAEADARSAQTALTVPDSGTARLSRARCLAYFHRFIEAGDELEQAARHGVPESDLLPERMSLLQACGRTREAIELCEQAVAQRRDSPSLGQLACLYAAAGAKGPAERTFDAAISTYSSVSPIAFSALCCDWAHAMEHDEDRNAAINGYLAALHALPNHARARRALDHLTAYPVAHAGSS
jgi:tetratricopeptide (TPR) repeat protein